jgi:hypothetical protein
MKKIFTLIIIITFIGLNISKAQYQMFGAANSLESNQFVIGVNPFFQIYNGVDEEQHQYRATNIYLAKGLSDFFDFRLKGGWYVDVKETSSANTYPTTFYGGIELESLVFKKGKSQGNGYGVAITTGVHVWGNKVGIDACLNLTYKIVPDLYVYSGFDSDINYEEISRINNVITKGIVAHYWVPIGIQVRSTDLLEFIGEVGIPIQKGDNYILGGGVNFYMQTKKKH